MKQKLNVIDLDNTLLPYDSFRKYIFIFLKNPRTFFRIVCFLILRKLRIIDSSFFKKYVVKNARKAENYNSIMKYFGEKLYKDINPSIFDKIKKQTDNQTRIVLCTASPEDYVKHLAGLLKWKYIASQLDSEQNYFIHMHGQNKVKTIKRLYPENRFKYNFAISDNSSDEKLLRIFSEYKLIKKSDR